MHQNKNKNLSHEPVLLAEVLEYLAPQKGDSYLDLTAGYGGHAKKVLELTGSLTSAVLVDRDITASQELKRELRQQIEIWQQDFYSAALNLKEAGRQFSLILADLGVSSPHLNNGNRGFAINQEGPLDMRMDQGQQLTAEQIVNRYSQPTIAKILRDYGEEPKAGQIAKAIVNARPLQTTSQLASVVSRQWPGHSRRHPATRTFQALRIAVNNELELLEKSLPIWLKLLAPGGRIAIISYHSLEDRLVKRQLAEASGDRYDASLRLLTKRPIVASQNEIALNPRARSAKLRAAVKKTRKESPKNANSG